jgi:hypothetical protein
MVFWRLPEYLLLALILDYYGREDGHAKCYRIMKKLGIAELKKYISTFIGILG